MAEQTTIKAGWLAKSLAGHDRNQWYVIVEVSESGVYVADGRLRTADKPKRKNPKHLQICKTDARSLLFNHEETLSPENYAAQEHLNDAKCLLRDEQIKCVLRRFGNMGNE